MMKNILVNYANYVQLTLKFLQDNAVNIVEKLINSTDLPQCRKIEDIVGMLVQLVYQDGRIATDLKQLLQ